MLRSEWLAGALAVLAIGLIAVETPSERAAWKVVERLGGTCEIEPRFGLDCLGVIVEIELADCKPTARDLAQLKYLRRLRVLDLSCTPIGDRELVQLVGSRCPFIIVPNGQTSAAVRDMFDEHQLGMGLGLAACRPPAADASAAAEKGREGEKGCDVGGSLARKRPHSTRRPGARPLKGYAG